MIRVLAFMGVFMLSIVGLVLLQPGNGVSFSPFAGEEVTRTDSAALLGTQVQTSEQIETQQTVTAALVQPQAQEAPAVTVAATQVTGQLAALQKLQKATDASLNQKAMTSAQGDMRALTSTVLAGLRGGQKTTGSGANALVNVVSKAINNAPNDDFYSAVQREARYGTVEFNKMAMVGAARDTADVKKRWIENARQKSKAMADATAFMTSGTKKTPGFDDTVHIVKRGDSLMKLSIRYYGRTLDYQVIFEANRDVLESPDKIRVGQKLKIPPMQNA